MKHLRLIFLLCAAFICSLAKADNPADGHTRYYITLSSAEKPGASARPAGTAINIDPTIAKKAQLSDADIQNIKKYRFPTLTEAMNYLTVYGWILDQVYTTSVPGRGSGIVWVLHKDVRKDLELSEGLVMED
ncbi:MAG: hypothetical protein NC402_06630 [Prevotella sp.]|nr:hypothetical protein [Prevotella sp.]MCM1075396.1 hypothetical protein [Ruminococcus sp.]